MAFPRELTAASTKALQLYRQQRARESKRISNRIQRVRMRQLGREERNRTDYQRQRLVTTAKLTGEFHAAIDPSRLVYCEPAGLLARSFFARVIR